MADALNEERFAPGIRLILQELRDLKIEAREDRRRADAAADADRRRAEASAEAARQQAEADRRRADADRQRSDERFEQALAATREAWADVRAVGQAIVKTLNRHSRILQSIDRKLGSRGNGRSPEDGGRA